MSYDGYRGYDGYTTEKKNNSSVIYGGTTTKNDTTNSSLSRNGWIITHQAIIPKSEVKRIVSRVHSIINSTFVITPNYNSDDHFDICAILSDNSCVPLMLNITSEQVKEHIELIAVQLTSTN